jgi:hypothetical protein
MNFCMETGKECYATKGDAGKASRGMAHGRGRNRAAKTEAYQCSECGAWHLASRERRKKFKHR